jgi:hypothetical protein
MGVAAALALSALSYPIGLALGQAWLLPLLNAAPAYLLMLALLRRGRRREAIAAMLAWAAVLAVSGTLSFALWPHDPGAHVLLGPEYRAEMFHWIRTGEGAEGSLRLFLPQHLGHLLAFVALSLASASSLSILLGAVLVDYMDYYVASLFRAGVPAGSVLLFGWQPWAISRVAAFCILGVVLAEPLLARLRPYPYAGLRASERFLRVAGAAILFDWLTKALFAPYWGRVLRGLLP